MFFRLSMDMILRLIRVFLLQPEDRAVARQKSASPEYKVSPQTSEFIVMC
jgi:hypothetical protein